MVDEPRTWGYKEIGTQHRCLRHCWGLIQKHWPNYIQVAENTRTQRKQREQINIYMRKGRGGGTTRVGNLVFRNFLFLRITFVSLFNTTDTQMIQLPANPICLAFLIMRFTG